LPLNLSQRSPARIFHDGATWIRSCAYKPSDLASNWPERRSSRNASLTPVPSFGVPIVVRGVFLSSTTPVGSTSA
jgi:hypothetical protein